MLFLKSKKSQSESSARDSNLSRDNDDNDSITTDTTLEELQNPASVSQRKKIRMNKTENNDQLLEIEKKKLEILQRESIKEKSDDLLFFESLLPYMANIPLRRKLWLRSKIQDLILAEIEAVENNIQQSVPVINIPVPNVNTQKLVEYELHIKNSSEQNLVHNIPMQMENDSSLISYINTYK